MHVTFLSVAQKEIFDSVAYYEQRDTGLGVKFMEEIEETVDLILQFPESGKLLNAYARRVLLNRFPFGIVYRVRNNKIIILAVMHLKREPNYWVRRS